jgi:hypothetical protein
LANGHIGGYGRYIWCWKRCYWCKIN